MQDIDAIKAEAEKADAHVQAEQKRLEEIERNNAEEIRKLEAQMQELSGRRDRSRLRRSARNPRGFRTIASSTDGDAMAVIEVHGKKPRTITSAAAVS